MIELAGLFFDQGKYGPAELLYKEMYEKCNSLLGPDHQDTLVARDNLSRVYTIQGKKTKAEQLLLKQFTSTELSATSNRNKYKKDTQPLNIERLEKTKSFSEFHSEDTNVEGAVYDEDEVDV